MPFTLDRFAPATSGRADPDGYLILGFDTEFQRYVDQPERRLKDLLQHKATSFFARLHASSFRDRLAPFVHYAL